MTKYELNKLHELATKLLGERLKELDEQYPDSDVYDLDSEELYDLDDGDRLCEGLDIVIGVVDELKGTDDDKPTLEEIKRVLQYLDEELLIEDDSTFRDVCEYVNQFK